MSFKNLLKRFLPMPAKSAYNQMEQSINEVIYLPTLRCNCRCAHCGINFSETTIDEMSCAQAAEAICDSSFVSDEVTILICGGEPFLREDLSDFVVPMLHSFDNCTVGITSNGTLPQRIEDFIQQINIDDIPRVGFAISIDGQKAAHNSIRKYSNAFDLAMESARILHTNGFGVQINTVLHPETVSGIEAFKNEIYEYCGGEIPFVFIPICSDVSVSEMFPYTDAQVREIFPYIRQSDFYTKHICSYGKIKATDHCHAGEQNIVLLPNQKLYTCHVGAAYSDDTDSYCIGSLLSNRIDDIWNGRLSSGALQHAKKCERCNNPCDVEREHRLFSFSYRLNKQELGRYFFLSGDDTYWGEGWHSIEIYEGGSHRWMANREAEISIYNSLSGGGSLKYLTSLQLFGRKASLKFH